MTKLHKLDYDSAIRVIEIIAEDDAIVSIASVKTAKMIISMQSLPF